MIAIHGLKIKKQQQLQEQELLWSVIMGRVGDQDDNVMGDTFSVLYVRLRQCCDVGKCCLGK